MFYIFSYLFFALVALVIVSYKCYEIKLIKNKNACSTWEAIKIYAATPVCKCNSNEEWSKQLFNDDEQRTSPAYSSFPNNIHHHEYYD